MTIELTEDARLTLPRELLVGRIVMIAFLSVLLLREATAGDALSGAEKATLWALLAVFSLGWIWFWWRLAAGTNYQAIAFTLALVAFSAVAIVSLNPIGVFPFYYAVVMAGAAYPWRAGIVLVTSTCALAIITWLTASGPEDAWEVLLVTALFGGSAVTVRRYVASQVALIQSQEALRQLATNEARADLARDLHDRLGQELTAGVLQAELLILDLHEAPSAIRQRAASVLKSARVALELMRETVAESRTPRFGSELSAAKTLLAAAGVSCSIDVRCAMDSDAAAAVLAWVVREGVTNVLRHSGAKRCSITVERSSHSFVLTIDDDGAGAGQTAPGSGLANMEHRVVAVGGSLVAEPQPVSGFRLIATVPVDA